MDILKDKVLRKTVSQLAEKLGYDIGENGVLKDAREETEYLGFSFYTSYIVDSNDKKSILQRNEVARKKSVEDLRNEFNNLDSKLRLLLDYLKLDFSKKEGLVIEKKKEVKETPHHCCHDED